MSKDFTLVGKSLIAGIGLLAMASAAQAEPVTLTAKQMDGVTAGVNLNVAVTTQVAVPIAISIVACPFCSGANISSSASATGLNDSTTF